MPAPVVTTQSGTGWTVNVTSLQLSSDVATKDFLVRHNGVTISNAFYTKTSSTTVQYIGTSLPGGTSIQIFRDSGRLVTDFAFGTLNSSASLNSAFTQVELIIEDLRQMLTIAGF